jgi:hypothetical protein
LVEPPIVIENREELIFMLSEASELEHMLMLEYLFAAFSLKTDVSEGLTDEQLVEGSREVARMVHCLAHESPQLLE